MKGNLKLNFENARDWSKWSNLAFILILGLKPVIDFTWEQKIHLGSVNINLQTLVALGVLFYSFIYLGVVKQKSKIKFSYLLMVLLLIFSCYFGNSRFAHRGCIITMVSNKNALGRIDT